MSMFNPEESDMDPTLSLVLLIALIVAIKA